MHTFWQDLHFDAKQRAPFDECANDNRRLLIRLVCCLAALCLFAPVGHGQAAQPPAPAYTPEQVADGVYLIRHRGTVQGNGNTILIIGDREALVVDSCLQPSIARRDVALIRQLTDKPVRYLLNTHWHNDHNSGNAVYMAAFPGLSIVAQIETKKDMDLHVPSLPARIADGLPKDKRKLETGLDTDGKPLTEAQKAAVKRDIEIRQAMIEEFKDFVYQPPTLTFERALNLDLGKRAVQVRHVGRGNTSGDAIVFLPQEKILVTGDLLVFPMPYMYDGYPSEWIETLEKLGQLNAQIILPGHGAAQRDQTYLYLVRDLLQSAVTQLNARLLTTGPAEFARFEEVKDHIDLTPFRAKFVGTGKASEAGFEEGSQRLIKLVFNEAVLR